MISVLNSLMESAPTKGTIGRLTRAIRRAIFRFFSSRRLFACLCSRVPGLVVPLLSSDMGKIPAQKRVKRRRQNADP